MRWEACFSASTRQSSRARHTSSRRFITSPPIAGPDGIERAVGHRHRRNDCRISGPTDWTPGQSATDGGVLRALGAGMCVRMELGIAAGFPHHRGIGYWWILSSGANVHRRAFSAKWRGRLVGFFQVNIVVGILVAYLSNFLIGRMNFGAVEWRWMLGIASLPASVPDHVVFHSPQSALAGTQGRVRSSGVLHLTGVENPSKSWMRLQLDSHGATAGKRVVV